jgi:hypothetical protein
MQRAVSIRLLSLGTASILTGPSTLGLARRASSWLSTLRCSTGNPPFSLAVWKALIIPFRSAANANQLTSGSFSFPIQIVETPNACSGAGCPWNTPNSYVNKTNPACQMTADTVDTCMLHKLPDGTPCCPYMSQTNNPCSDKLFPSAQVDNTAPPFTLNNQQYTLQFTGFTEPGSSQIQPYFLSDEQQNTVLILFGQIVPFCPGGPGSLCGTQPSDSCAERRCSADNICSLQYAFLPCMTALSSPIPRPCLCANMMRSPQAKAGHVTPNVHPPCRSSQRWSVRAL